MHRSNRALGRGLVAVILLALSGCGGSVAKTVPVKGVVTLAGGAWPAPATIQFTPLSAADGFPLRPASGNVQLDGTFKVTSFEPGDGLLPGKYEVSVECWKSQPQMSPTGGGMIDGQSAVPDKYRSGKTSGWIVEVPAGSGPLELKYDVPTK